MLFRSGVQSILWRYIEGEVEGAAFRLNDIYCQERVPKAELVHWLRHKERKFGRGCVEQWRQQQDEWLKRLEQCLVPFEVMVAHQPFLLGTRPRFVDFDLYGMLGCFLSSGHYELPAAHTQIKAWHRRMAAIRRGK